MQDQIFSEAFQILEAAIAERAFPAASIAVTHGEKLVALKAFGNFTFDRLGAASLSSLPSPQGGHSEICEGAPSKLRLGGDFANSAVTSSTLFDLASLTKVLATTTMAMVLYERGLLDLEASIAGTLPEFLADAAPDPRRHEVTFRMLLAHSSGLPAYEKLFLRAHARDELLRAAFAVPLNADPNTRAEYSDIGFIILGVALERLAGEALDTFCQREIFGPLAMTRTTFNPARELRPQIPPTADETDTSGTDTLVRPSTFRSRIVQGEVQDENAFVLGGVAPHAGLFSTAEDVARFAHAMLGAGTPIVRPETVAIFTERQPSPAGTSRALGWDTPSHPSQSGKHFGPRSFGHLGYTGTSLWVDPDRQLSITLLTNRTWPDCSNQAIKQVRPKFHDAVIEAVTKLK
ncbi:MAG TPA: serine hydrolase domain-containing protein [Candidatus Sulfotelmatobacter sp.]|nr:serine hydrolase domain-containing protein [Candidatus Sulfotelmatobacter sp.]